MAALFCASEEGNVDGLKELSEMAANIDLNTANKVNVTPLSTSSQLISQPHLPGAIGTNAFISANPI